VTATGNRCGHDPRNPVFDLAVAVVPNLPPILFTIVAKVRELVYYQRWMFADLGEAKRSERMEAIVRVLCALTFHTDLISMRVGFLPTDADPWFRGATAKTIARWTGMRRGRVTRALDDLRWAGYITSKQPREFDDEVQEWRGLAAVRNLTPKFFTRLHVKNDVDKARNEACNRMTSARRAGLRAEKHRRTQRQRVAAKVARLANDASSGGPIAPPLPSERGLRLHQIKLELRAQHPDWGPRELSLEALRLLED
jgi:hypothetical protein